jgi:hypothetical protein
MKPAFLLTCCLLLIAGGFQLYHLPSHNPTNPVSFNSTVKLMAAVETETGFTQPSRQGHLQLLTLYSLKTHFNIFLPFTPSLSK